MTPRDADRIIKAGRTVTVRTKFGEQVTTVFVRRDRWNIESQEGWLLDRDELQIVQGKQL